MRNSNSDLVRSFLEEASCCCWEWYLKNDFAEEQVAAFIWFQPIHIRFIWTAIPFLVEATTISKYGRCLLFCGLGASFNTILFFSHLFREFRPDNLSPYQGTLFLLSDFLRHTVCDVNPVKKICQTVCHHKRGIFSTWVVFTNKHFHPYG